MLLSNEYFHVGQHDLLLLKNQVSSMITGIQEILSENKDPYLVKEFNVWIKEIKKKY
ncbi:hypothetical protein [Escherichia coli]|uniref:hypothetical protein n=1 Tax=Escherichia coli TaxID=562 RepID=UPI000A86B385|nr:hypothetical protein [Escherichia coli]